MNYNIDTILTSLSGLVKFRPDFDTDNLDNDLIGTSDSGLYFNSGVNGLITLKNIFALSQNTTKWNISAWADSVTYQKNQVVSVSGDYYYSLSNDNLNKNPASDKTNWQKSTLQSIWIRREIWSTIEQVMADVVKASPLIDHELLYRVCDTTNRLTNDSKFVGFEIRPRNSEHLKVVLNRVSAQFSEANTDLTLYLYNQNTKVAEFLISNEANDLRWTSLSSENELSGHGKRWFLFYDQDDITGHAITHEFVLHNKVSAFVDLLPFEVPNTTTNFLKDVDGYTGESYGLGLDLTISCDLTQFIITNKMSFAKLLQYQFAFRMLDLFVFNPEARENLERFNISVNREIIMAELRSENKNSIVSILNNEKTRVRNALKFGDVCLPCDNENTIYNLSNFG
jgi:hypothetical protein